MPTMIFSVVIISSISEEWKAHATSQPKTWETFSKVSLTLSFLDQLQYFSYFDTFFPIKLNQKKNWTQIFQVLQGFSLYTFCKIFWSIKTGFPIVGGHGRGAPISWKTTPPPSLKPETPFNEMNPRKSIINDNLRSS